MAKRLTIGLVLDTSLDPVDGVQQYVVAVGEWLRGRGHDVHYLVGQSARRDLPNVHSLSRNITVRANGNRTTIPLFARARAIRAVLREHPFDVLHVQTPHHPLMAQRIILQADPRTAVIGTFHIVSYSWLAVLGTKLLGWSLRPSLKRFDEMVSVSPAAAAFAEATFKMHTAVVPNVIDYAGFHGAKPLPAYADEVPTILFLGRLVPRKGALLLLQAAAELRSRGGLPAFRVLVCGRGPLEPKLRQFAAEHDLADAVEFLGFISEADKPRYYASADIAAFPASGGESFGIVLPEAMAAGRAVVLAGDNPGYRSVMAPQPELLFDPHDPAALADKLAYYLTHAAAARRMRAWGAGYAEQFDINAVGARLLAIYEQALRKRRGA